MTIALFAASELVPASAGRVSTASFGFASLIVPPFVANDVVAA
jgi:hypothetical protein